MMAEEALYRFRGVSATANPPPQCGDDLPALRVAHAASLALERNASCVELNDQRLAARRLDRHREAPLRSLEVPVADQDADKAHVRCELAFLDDAVARPDDHLVAAEQLRAQCVSLAVKKREEVRPFKRGQRFQLEQLHCDR